MYVFSIEKLGIIEKSRFSYLNKTGCYTVDGVNDTHEFDDVVNAMSVINMSSEDQFNIFKLLAGILHLGNVHFKSEGNYAQPENLNSTCDGSMFAQSKFLSDFCS